MLSSQNVFVIIDVVVVVVVVVDVALSCHILENQLARFLFEITQSPSMSLKVRVAINTLIS